MRPRRAAGFTLLEILVVLVVLGLLVATLARGVDFGLNAWGRQTLALAARGELETVDRALRRLIEHMDPGAAGWPATVAGGPHTLAFATDLPAAPARQAEVALGVDRAHRLVLHWHPRLAVAAAEQATTLLEGVERLELRYWRPGGPGGGGAWLDAWQGQGLPGLVRLRIVFRPGDPRHWPDLIAAPMRARPVVQRVPAARLSAVG
jgi:general secretion pathway protein J